MLKSGATRSGQSTVTPETLTWVVKDVLPRHGYDARLEASVNDACAENAAKWMQRALRVGGVDECRRIIALARASIVPTGTSP